MQKRREKAWGIFSRDTSLEANVIRDLAFCASCTKMGKAPTESYTEHMKHTQATRHDSKGLPNVKMPSYDAIFPWSGRTYMY